MKYLLDTSVWLWALSEPDRIAKPVRDKFVANVDELFLSVASAWEVVLKHAKGKLSLPEPPASYIPSRMAFLGLRSLPVSQGHVLEIAALPLHHGDPFDRLIIAQARVEEMTLLTADRAFRKYDVPILWAGR